MGSIGTAFEEPRPKTPQMRDLTDRLKHYGATDDFCRRLYATGTTAPPEFQPKMSTVGTAQGVQVPRLMIPRVAGLANKNPSPRTRGKSPTSPTCRAPPLRNFRLLIHTPSALLHLTGPTHNTTCAQGMRPRGRGCRRTRGSGRTLSPACARMRRTEKTPS